MEIKISGTPEEIAALVQTLVVSETPMTIGAPQIAYGTISVEHLKRKEVSPLDVPSSEADVFNSIQNRKGGVAERRA